MYDQDVYDPYIHHRYTLNSYQVKDYWFSIKITGMSTPTFLQELVCTLAYNLCAGLAAFDAWSPLKSPYILVWGFMVYATDSMIREWFSITSASKGNIFKNKRQRFEIQLEVH